YHGGELILSKSPFLSYELLYRIDLKIELVLPLRIGSGRNDTSPVEPELPVIKDVQDRPIIPGSSLKGFFRANTLRLLNGLSASHSAIVNVVFGDSSCHASCLHFSDLSMTSGKVGTRKHIGIDLQTGAGDNGRLFEVEMVAEGSVFEGLAIRGRNLNPVLLGLIHAVKSLCNNGVCRLGGFKSRGYGHVKMNVTRLDIEVPCVSLDAIAKGIRRKTSVSMGGVQEVQLAAVRNGIKFGAGADLEFPCTVEMAPEILGVRIRLSEPERFLESMANILQRQLPTARQGGD
ncbi:MAG: RAMP superfamily CRISPR-associated protein, partial [Candidatus Thorarchaeota archaeon]